MIGLQSPEVFEFQGNQIHFGGKSPSLSTLRQKFPQHEICELKQTHSDVLLPASTQVREGDAHWSKDPQQILVVKTADCIPCLVISPGTGIRLAIHSGWRGVENQIILKSLQKLELHKDPQLQIWMGPHIQQKSFEVDEDVAIRIFNAYELPLKNPFTFTHGNKYHIALSRLVASEIQRRLKISEGCFHSSSIDTLTDDRYHSYRGQDRGVSNYSFILPPL